MKKHIFLIGLLSLLFVYTYAQTVSSGNTVPGYKELKTKARKQKTAAWICLGGGFALFTTGIIIDVIYLPATLFSSIGDDPQPLPAGAQVAVVAGAAGIIASIPLFITASNNKHKAKLMLTSQKTATGLPIAVPKNITGITLAVSL